MINYLVFLKEHFFFKEPNNETHAHIVQKKGN